jgi:DNA-binding IclR family transcriptional regulator
VAQLYATTGAVSHLFIPSYRGVACVVHCDGSRRGRCPEPMLRELLPAHATAAGKVLLAFRQPWRDSVLANALPRYTDATVTCRLDIERNATHTRARGYAIDDGEYQYGVLGIAAPVFAGGVGRQVHPNVLLAAKDSCSPPRRRPQRGCPPGISDAAALREGLSATWPLLRGR